MIARTMSASRLESAERPPHGELGRRPTIDVAEPASFALLGMMESTGPVYRDVALVPVQPRGALHAAAGADAAKLEEAVKHGAVVPDVVLALLAHMIVHVVGRDLLQEFDVLVRVELRHLGRDGGFRALRRVQVSIWPQSWGEELGART